VTRVNEKFIDIIAPLLRLESKARPCNASAYLVLMMHTEIPPKPEDSI
jgi:hypothetical protein